MKQTKEREIEKSEPESKWHEEMKIAMFVHSIYVWKCVTQSIQF